MPTRPAARAALVALALCPLLAVSAPAQPAQFGDLAAGPYRRLVIRNAMVIPGHGGPPAGPYDIVIEGNTIADLIPFDPVTAERRGDTARASGDRIIDATGMFVMPGMIDLHMHLRTQPMENEYVYSMKLAHGTTAMVPAPDRGLDSAMAQARLSAENRILAPRLYPIWNWGANTRFTRAQREDPAMAPQIAREMAAQGMRVTSLGSVTWSRDLFGAAAKAVTAAGGSRRSTSRRRPWRW